jgi:hypothetical protein
MEEGEFPVAKGEPVMTVSAPLDGLMVYPVMVSGV